MTHKSWQNRYTSLFDMTDREFPHYVGLVFVRRILMKSGKKAIVTLVAPMPNEWFWNFEATTLEVLHTRCADPREYTGFDRIIELSNCKETYRRIDNLMTENGQDVCRIDLVMFIECDVSVVFDREAA